MFRIRLSNQGSTIFWLDTYCVTLSEAEDYARRLYPSCDILAHEWKVID